MGRVIIKYKEKGGKKSSTSVCFLKGEGLVWSFVSLTLVILFVVVSFHFFLGSARKTNFLVEIWSKSEKSSRCKLAVFK